MESNGQAPKNTTSEWFQGWVLRYGKWIKAGFRLYVENFALLLGVTAIALVLGGVTLFLLFAPLSLGVYLVVLKLVDRTSPPPKVTDIFAVFSNLFMQPFLLGVIVAVIYVVSVYFLGEIVLLGPIFRLLLPVALSTLVLFALPIIADKRLPFTAAVLESVEIVKKDLPGFALFAFAVLVANSWGWTLFGANHEIVGVLLCLVSAPIGFTSVAIAYREFFPAQVVEGAASSQ